MAMRHYKARPRHMRAFFDWLYSNQQRLSVPLTIEKRSNRSVYMYFGGINKAIFVYVNKWCIEVVVERDNRSSGALVLFEVAPIFSKEGYRCRHPTEGVRCHRDPQRLFHSREELWETELFEPFLRWINSELATARFVALYDDASPGLHKDVPPHSNNVRAILELGITHPEHIPIHLRTFYKMQTSGYSYYMD